MLSTVDILDTLNLEEDVSLEAKEAAGRDGQGEVPRSLLETYSAMANTYGGVVLLGIKEKPKGSFSIKGIEKPSAVLKQLWDLLNDRNAVSSNLLTEASVSVLKVQGKNIVQIKIPRASRLQRPVYKGQNPLAGTYRRNHEGDYLCDIDTVKRMLAEQVEENRDAKLLDGFTFDDIDTSSFAAYRRQFKAVHLVHPWLDLDDSEFLRSIGGFAVNRETGAKGITLAGLLMFGKLPSILEAVPNYVLDYQERPSAKADGRWIDRVTTDGKWSGNLFDFFRKVMPKLTEDLKVPFKLKGERRVDDSPVHEALREAFVNTLIHADYTGRVSVLVVKRPDLFGFRNPGMMRISLKDAIQGGMSDCRNRNLQKMFQLAGLGEQAGSGIPKIYMNWNQQHWRAPQLFDTPTPEQTLLKLQMLSLIPQDTLDELEQRLGARFESLSDVQRLALATVCIEGLVNHARLKEMCTHHSRDLTIALSGLVREGILETDGLAKGTVYYFAGESPNLVEMASDLDLEASVPLLTSSVPFGQGSVPLEVASVPLPLPQSVLLVSQKKKATKDEIRDAIHELCTSDFMTLRALAKALSRQPEYLRIKHLNEMLSNGELTVRFPGALRHPQQAYKSDR